MRKLWNIAFISILSVIFAACGSDDESENVASPKDDICVIDVSPIPMAPKSKDAVMAVKKDYYASKAPMIDLSLLELRPLLTHATESDFAEVVLKSKFPVIVDFYADWCGPCNYIAPYVKDLAKLYPQIMFVKYDIDDDSFTAGSPCYEYNVQVIPTFKFFYLGNEYVKYGFTGAQVDVLTANIVLFLDELKGVNQN